MSRGEGGDIQFKSKDPERMSEPQGDGGRGELSSVWTRKCDKSCQRGLKERPGV